MRPAILPETAPWPWTPALESELRYWLRLAYRRYSADRIDAGCTGKASFPDPVSARLAMPRRDQSYGAHPYRCKNCHQWHIGSVPRALKKPIRTLGGEA